MRGAFRTLKAIEKASSHYSGIESFDEAKKVKNRMLELAMDDRWYPVVA